MKTPWNLPRWLAPAAVAMALAGIAHAQTARPAGGGASSPPAATATERAAARVHAQDVADVFGDACLRTKADPEAAADWALQNGFVMSTASGREMARHLLKEGEAGNVFSRGPKDEALLLVSTANPPNCLVMGLQRVDGPRMRGRMEALVSEWPGGRVVPEPGASKDFDADGPHRTLTFLAVNGHDRYRLMVISPIGVAPGVAIMGVSIEPR